MARNNAIVAEENAKPVEAAGNENIFRVREQTAQEIGAERASFGAAGVDVNRGSASRVQQDTARVGAANELTLRQNIAREAYGYRVQPVNFQNEAAAREAEAANARKAGRLGALTSLISGASSTGAKYGKYKLGME